MIRRLCLVGVLPLLLVSFLLAQYGGSGYTIVRADYGAGNRWRDVTSRVNSMVQGSSLSFRVTNEAMGGDPAPEEHKTLRLQVRGAQGEMRTLSYREKDTVNLPIAVAAASWGGGLQITRAQYGSGNRMWDVTDRVRAQLQNNQISLRVTNDSMGGDPAEGRHKALTVWYTDRGSSTQTTVNEGEYLNLGGGNTAPPLAPQFGGLRILRAEYGVGERLLDVTTRLSSQVQGSQLSLRITNETMGGDPAEEHAKQLTVWYWYNGRAARVVVPEKSTLTLPGTSFDYIGNLHVMRAQYGADYRFLDVTALLNSSIQGDQLTLRITNDTMGADPAPERPKILTVFYVYNGQPARVTVNEKDTLNLPGAAGAGWNSSPGQLQVLRAVYGIGDLGMDVTARLGAQITGDTLNLPVNGDTMGGDPAPGQVKRLKVIYLWQGLRYETNVPERGVLSLP